MLEPCRGLLAPMTGETGVDVTRRRDDTEPRARLSPTATVDHLTDDLMEAFAIPPLPDSVPQRLADAIQRRVAALLYCLREAKNRRYVGALEIRLVRDTFRAVLTAYELQLPDCEAHYATFRQLVEDLGYERVEAGFRKRAGNGGEGP
jgi:hypothetical protein